jgi:hypothetical protein
MPYRLRGEGIALWMVKKLLRVSLASLLLLPSPSGGENEQYPGATL